MRRLALWLLVPATVALAGDFDGRWDATIASGAAHIPFRMEVSESPARVCFFEDTQPACSTSAEIKDGTLTARWDYINTELQLRVKDGALTGSYASLRSQRSRPSAIEAKHYQPPPPPAQPPAKLDGEWEIHTKAHHSAGGWRRGHAGGPRGRQSFPDQPFFGRPRGGSGRHVTGRRDYRSHAGQL